MAISMLKIRRPLGRLIFNMGIAIPGKTVFLIETAPWNQCDTFSSSKQQMLQADARIHLKSGKENQLDFPSHFSHQYGSLPVTSVEEQPINITIQCYPPNPERFRDNNFIVIATGHSDLRGNQSQQICHHDESRFSVTQNMHHTRAISW